MDLSIFLIWTYTIVYFFKLSYVSILLNFATDLQVAGDEFLKLGTVL